MLPLTAVAGAAVVLCLIWLALSGWIVIGRARHDRLRRWVSDDAARLSNGGPAVWGWSRRRLWRIADGNFGSASAIAARELVRRDSSRLWHRALRRGFGRTHALRVLARGGSPLAFEALGAARADGRPDVIAAVVAIAAEVDTRQADEFLLDVLVSGDHPRSRAATELAPRAQHLVRELLELAGHPDPATRYWALMLLANVAAEPGVRVAAIEGATDTEAPVRSAAARLLGATGSAEVLPVIRSLLADDVFFVRAHAARAVGEAQARPLAGEVAALLADENWWVRAAAKESLLALAESGFEAAVAALHDDDRFARDGAAEVILGFGRLGALEDDATSSELLERLAG